VIAAGAAGVWARRARLAGALLALVSCGHGRAAPARPSVAEVRGYHYQDSSGLLVGTYGAWVRQSLPGGVRGEARVIADYVRLDPDRGFDPTRPDADRRAPDAVTSASATVGGGQILREWRWEGLAAADVEREVAGAPVSVGVLARGSTEPDYRSVSGALRADAELFERNTAVALVVGHGRDRVLPVEAPRGHEALWPASHQRWTATMTLAQLLTSRLFVGAGLGGTWQRGTLSSPYRRAVVAPSLLLPEALPRARDRYTAFLSASLSLTSRLAVHLRQGAYADSWSVRALIPEATVAAEVYPGVLMQLGYRFYGQTRASFYEVDYPEARPLMAGDLRLGAVHDHTVSLDVRRPLGGAGLPLSLGYQLSTLEYRGVRSRVVAHVFQLGVGAEY
jgi:hypothetical protein